MDDLDHYSWFRRLVQNQIASEKRWQKADPARSSLLLRCYESREEFESQFPDPVQRRDFLEELESHDDFVRHALRLTQARGREPRKQR